MMVDHSCLSWLHNPDTNGIKNKKLINHRNGDFLKNNHFCLMEPSFIAVRIKRTIESDNKALLHNMPHHIKAMDTGIIVFFMKYLVDDKNKIFMMASIHRN
jgi:hypothetical protein